MYFWLLHCPPPLPCHSLPSVCLHLRPSLFAADFMLYYPLSVSSLTPALPVSSLSAGAHHSFSHENRFSLNLLTQHCFYSSSPFILQRSLSVLHFLPCTLLRLSFVTLALTSASLNTTYANRKRGSVLCLRSLSGVFIVRVVIIRLI